MVLKRFRGAVAARLAEVDTMEQEHWLTFMVAMSSLSPNSATRYVPHLQAIVDASADAPDRDAGLVKGVFTAAWILSRLSRNHAPLDDVDRRLLSAAPTSLRAMVTTVKEALDRMP